MPYAKLSNQQNREWTDGISLWNTPLPSKQWEANKLNNAREIFDVSGAGDTVIASFASAIISGFDAEASTRFANKAAGIVVGHIGTTAITSSELKN